MSDQNAFFSCNIVNNLYNVEGLMRQISYSPSRISNLVLAATPLGYDQFPLIPKPSDV